MRMTTALPFMLAAIVTVLQCSASIAASSKPSKKWEMLTACQYVTDKNNDGDSFRIRCGEQEFVLRLYFVDAPETHMRDMERLREQSEHFGVGIEQTQKSGLRAGEAVREALKGTFNVWTRRAAAGGRGKDPRYYGLVEVDGKNLTEFLVGNGLARIKGIKPNLPTGEKAKAYVERLNALEAEARKQRLGVWAEPAK